MKLARLLLIAAVLCFAAAVEWTAASLPALPTQDAKQRDAAQNKVMGPQIGEFVVDAFEDSQGNLWFGTMAKGTARFDGAKLTYLSTKDGLVGNTVASIAEDRDGNLWFGTHSGASRFDGKSFTNFGADEGLHGAGCQFLIDADGNIWAATNHGVFRFDGTAFKPFEIPRPEIKDVSYKWEPGKVWSLMQDKQGNMWFGRDGFGATRFDGSSFTHFTKDDGLASNNVSQILEDRQGNIWFASLTSDQPESIKEGGVARYDGTSFTSFPDVAGLTANDIYTLFADSQGHVWIGATGVGAYRYDGNTFTLFKQTDREDLTRNFGVQDIIEDRLGNLWFGFSGGLFRFDGTSFVNVTQDGPWK